MYNLTFLTDSLFLLLSFSPVEKVATVSILQILNMQVLKVTSMFSVKLSIAIMGGIILGLPVIIYQFWRFVSPAFEEKHDGGLILTVLFATIAEYYWPSMFQAQSLNGLAYIGACVVVVGSMLTALGNKILTKENFRALKRLVRI